MTLEDVHIICDEFDDCLDDASALKVRKRLLLTLLEKGMVHWMDKRVQAIKEWRRDCRLSIGKTLISEEAGRQLERIKETGKFETSALLKLIDAYDLIMDYKA